VVGRWDGARCPAWGAALSPPTFLGRLRSALHLVSRIDECFHGESKTFSLINAIYTTL
jgi:hypothetical protein